MSIFSRLFKGQEEGDKEAAQSEGVAAEARPERARKPTPDAARGAQAAHDAKGSMRPEAPSFQINPPSERGQVSITAAPVVQVGAPASKPGGHATQHRSATPASKGPPGAPPSAHGPAETPSGRAKVGAATAKLGSATKPSSGSHRAAPPLPPPTGGRASPPPVPSGKPASRPRLDSSATGFNALKPPVSPPDPPLDGPLTLELGTSPVKSAGTKRGSNTAQGLAPAARTARSAAAQATAPAPEHEANLQNDLDAAFGAMVEAPNGARREGPPEVTYSGGSELRELFASLAANHMRQVREFMIGVKWGEAPRDWVPICEPAVVSLLRAAKEMELPDLCDALEGYRGALATVSSAPGATIADGARESLLSSYMKLAELMPEAFGLDGERGRRESIIVHALLQQVPDVRKVTIDKIYAAGLTNLDNLFLARPDEISATTGIGEGLASRIVEKFQRYRREIASLADATRATERKRLAELAAELSALHHEFERAASGWSDDERAEKRKFRQARAEALLQVKVLLARVGEVDRLSLIERLPFGRKIEELERYLREAKANEASVP